MVILTASTGMANITSGISDIMGVATTMLDTILGNAIFAALFSVGFIKIGLGLVRRFKHS